METKSEMTLSEVAKAIGGKITVLQKVKGKGGKPAMQPVERDLRAGDILSFTVDGKKLIAVTADGRKREAGIS